MRKLPTISLCLCLIISGCVNRNKQKPIENEKTNSVEVYFFDFEGNLKDVPTDTFTINAIAKNITFIPLETSAESLLTVVDLRVARIDDKYYVSSMAGSKFSGILEFDLTGHYVGYLVPIGRGPKELPHLFDWSYNSNVRLLSAYTSNEMLLHSFEKNNTSKFGSGGHFGYCRPLNDGTMVGLPNIFGSEDSKTPYLLFFSQNGEVIKSLYYAKKRNIYFDFMATQGKQVGPVDAYSLYPSYSGDALFQDVYNDTIYRVKSMDEVEPYIILGRGALAPDVKEVLDRTVKGKRVTLRRLLEVEHYFFIVYEYKNMHYSAIWDKRNSSLIANMETDFFKIPVIHNLGFTKYRTPNGSEIFIGISGYSDGTLYGVLGADQAMEFLGGMDEHDNPVLMVIEL